MSLTLPELHPAQQGLKRCDLLPESGGHPDFQNYIQHNKDWNSLIAITQTFAKYLPELHPAQQGLKLNKKRNLSGHWISSRTTSSTTRIETLICEIKPFSISRIQNYIQHNKDWNFFDGDTVRCTNCLPELHPAQQGLKPNRLTFWSSYRCLPELHPAQQGLKLRGYQAAKENMFLPELHPAQQGLKLRTFSLIRTISTLPELHPA